MSSVLFGLVFILFFGYQAGAAEPTAKPAPQAVQVWPHDGSDLRPDSRVIWGRLDNGLRYAVLPTKSAPARGSLRMLVLAGSGMEDDDQQGAAHFLEHMAFNGTKHFPAGDTFEYFQRLGMAFGAHTNALTNVDYTVYQLELSRTQGELMQDGFKLFRDFFDGILLEEREIDKERGVILSEHTARNTASYRAAIGHIHAATEGTKAANRLPLGKPEIVKKISQQRLRDFYETWYTPGRTIIIAVGDFDAASVEREIRSRFNDAKAPRGETADQDWGKPTAGRGITTRFNAVPDASAVTVTLCRATPVANNVDSKAQQRNDILDVLTTGMIDARMEKLTEAKDAVIDAASIGNEQLYHLVQRDYLAVRCKPENWQAAVATAEQEMRRALQHGFTEQELANIRKQFGGLLEGAVQQAESQQPNSLADEMVKMLTERSVFISTPDFAELCREFLPTVQPSDCTARLRSVWGGGDLEIAVSGNVSLSTDAAEQIKAAFVASCGHAVEPPVDAKSNAFAYTDFGPAGKIVHRSEQADFGIVQATFANGVRVNIKPTKFEKGIARTIIHFGGGLLELPNDKPGLQIFAQSAFIAGGLKGMTLNDLNRQIGDKNVGIVFGVGDEAFQLGGPCLASSMELQLQVCTAYLTAPGFAPEMERQFYDVMDSLHAQRTHTMEGMLRFDAAAFLRSDDVRYRLPQPAEVRKLKLTDVQAWLAEPLAHGYLEATIVGDVDPEQTLQMVAKTLGALAPRDAEKPAFASAKHLSFPAAQAKEFRYDSDTPRCASAVCWAMPGAKDVAAYRHANMLKLLLADRVRLKVREELGVAYTPSVDYVAGDAYPDYGFFAVQVCVAPENFEKIGPLVAETAAELASGEISDDEFQRALQPLLSGIDAQRLDNNFWLEVISDCQMRPSDLDDVRTKKSAYEAMRKADVAATARKFLKSTDAVTVSVTPKAIVQQAAK